MRLKLKKLEEVDKSTRKLGEVFEKTSQLATEILKATLRSSQSQTAKLVAASDELVETFTKINASRKFFEVKQDPECKFPWIRHDIVPLGGIRVRINGEEYDLTPEIQTAFTDTRYKFNNSISDDESVLTFDNILESLDYKRTKFSNSKRTKTIKKELEKRADKILNPPIPIQAVENKEGSDNIQGEGMEIVIPSNIIDIWTRLKVVL